MAINDRIGASESGSIGASGMPPRDSEAPTLRRRAMFFTSVSGLALLGLIVLFINILANWAFLRLDITQRRAYSLSDSSKRLVRNLEDPVLVKAFFTPDLPAPYNSYERYVRDILAEYHAASRGKVRYQFMLTEPAKNFEQQAAEANLVPLQFEQMGADQLQIRRGFMGLVFYYRDHSETLPVIRGVEGLEFDITSRIARMAKTRKKVIAVMTGHGETEWQGTPLKTAQDLDQLYDIQRVALTAGVTAPIQADAVLIAGPNQTFDEKSLWAIDQTIMRGTPAAFLLDAKNLELSRFMVFPQNTGLADLLKAYGIRLGNQLVYDAQCQTIGVSQNVGGFAFTTSIRYPFIPMVTQLDKNQPLTRGIETVAVPFTVAVDPVREVSGVQMTPLLSSSAQSWLAPAQAYNISPNNIPQPKPNDPHGPYTLGAVVTGSFPSYFQGKPSPVAGQTLIGTSPKTSLFVLGTSHILDPKLPEFPGADALISNVLAYLSHDDTLIGIRSKGEVLRPLKPVSGSARELIKLLCTLGAALLPVAWGLFRWRSRRTWRHTLSAAFSKANTLARPESPSV